MNFFALQVINFHRLYHVIDKKIQQLLEGGLIGYNMRYWNERRDLKRLVAEGGPQLLTLQDLEAGFIICMVPLVVSGLVFVLEVMIKKMFS